ncbi:MAG: ATP-binding protein [Alphaproteobacteria bacterium]|nr:ATP-binding protein [Alphaproteobacteria bacterium]
MTKLSAKLVALYLVIIGTTLIGILSALETREYYTQRRNLVADLQELIKTQSLPVTTALWELDTEKIDTFLAEVGSLPFVQGAAITDSTGKLVSSIGDINAPPKSVDFAAEAPLVFQRGAISQPLGSIKIIVHDREILSTIADRLVNDTIILLVLLVVLAGATILITNAIVGRPLMLLQASIEKIRLGGGREQVKWAASDELGEVVSAFNKLQSAQDASEEALKQARDDLELRVDQRTAELRKTNASVLAEIKERKRAEEALRESEARAKAMLNTGSQLQGLLKPDGTLIEINAAALAMIGASEEDVLGLPFWDCPWWTHDPDLQAQLRQALKRAADGESVQFLATHHEADGTEHIINFGATPVRDENGEVALIVPMGDDITHLKQAEAELREAKEQAETALAKLTTTQQQLVHSQKLASLGELTAGIAHEIKNPLNFVNNFAEVSTEMLEELQELVEPIREQLDEEASEELDELVTVLSDNLDRINRHGQRANNIVNSMLQHSRGNDGERMETTVNELVGEALNLAYHGERARDNNFQVTLEEHFDEAAGTADLVPQEMNRVLVNLLSNAFYAVKAHGKEAAPEGYAPTVAVTTEDKGPEVEIRIRDNGTGMPKEVREKLFDPFFTTKPTGEGTGLGLSMSFDIVVLQHGGQIEVESEPGAFTEFAITLPRHFSDGQRSGDGSRKI